MKMLLPILITLASCGGKTHKSKATLSPLDEVRAKRDLYMQLAKAEVDEYGWLAPRCDGLLFNSIARYAGFPVDPTLSEIAPGKWERHPSRCFRNGSKSSISRDMFRGLLLYLYTSGDFQNIREIKAYCDANEVLAGTACAMGEAVDEESYWGRVVMTHSMRSQIQRMLSKEPKADDVEPVTLKSGFEAHLDVLRIWTNYKIDGALSWSDVDTLRGYAQKSPRNALFQILSGKFSNDGDQQKAIDILLDESLFPKDRLPDEQDRYAHYIWQRDENEDWEPCGSSEKRPCEGVTHSGIDLMFAVKLLEE